MNDGKKALRRQPRQRAGRCGGGGPHGHTALPLLVPSSGPRFPVTLFVGDLVEAVLKHFVEVKWFIIAGRHFASSGVPLALLCLCVRVCVCLCVCVCVGCVESLNENGRTRQRDDSARPFPWHSVRLGPRRRLGPIDGWIVRWMRKMSPSRRCTHTKRTPTTHGRQKKAARQSRRRSGGGGFSGVNKA